MQDKIKNAGIVGAGGGGFPAHVKAASKVDIVIANGAECEPLIHKDYELMLNHPERVVHGLLLLMESTGAKRGIIGVKAKNNDVVETLRKLVEDSILATPKLPITIHQLGDFYPSGDEFILVYEATKRLIPPQGIPLDVGVVVNNVETLYNISRAKDDDSVTEKFITVAGAVKHPVSFLAPIGMSYRDAIESAGGVSVKEFGVFVGGVMMGKLEFELDKPITKTTAGLIVLPKEHTLIQRKSQPEKAMHRIGKSACDQCSYCTELCPRYILGYDVQPHKVMRSLSFTTTGENIWNQFAELCCACGLCTLYACPESLFPKEACDKAKHDLKEQSIKWSGRKEVEPHPMYEGRRTPLKQLMKRLGVEEYNHASEFCKNKRKPSKVEIPLSQHIGSPALPIVRVGESVKRGQCIGEIPEGKLGARVHA
ncbi:MAG: 4Fe-4S dicluster domain-containing protein, partial [Ignavibacteriae bacterium]|nr:4Fe-4S dicluster domain-containing protein [Ignavibacteriota bacterium]